MFLTFLKLIYWVKLQGGVVFVNPIPFRGFEWVSPRKQVWSNFQHNSTWTFTFVCQTVFEVNSTCLLTSKTFSPVFLIWSFVTKNNASSPIPYRIRKTRLFSMGKGENTLVGLFLGKYSDEKRHFRRKKVFAIPLMIFVEKIFRIFKHFWKIFAVSKSVCFLT